MSIYIKTYATDGIDSLTTLDKLEIFASVCPLMEIFVKVNFNAKNPSSHNIYNKYDDQEYCKVYENGRWVKRKSLDVMDKVLDAKIFDLKTILAELKDYINDDTKIMIANYIEHDCADEKLRTSNVDPRSILKKGITIESIPSNNKTSKKATSVSRNKSSIKKSSIKITNRRNRT